MAIVFNNLISGGGSKLYKHLLEINFSYKIADTGISTIIPIQIITNFATEMTNTNVETLLQNYYGATSLNVGATAYPRYCEIIYWEDVEYTAKEESLVIRHRKVMFDEYGRLKVKDTKCYTNGAVYEASNVRRNSLTDVVTPL